LRAQAGDVTLEAMAGGAGSSIGRGGMLTKVLAAKRAARSGAHTVIAWGREDNVLTRLANGEAIGTQLTAPTARLTARRQWMVDHLHTAGELVLDAGAVRKLKNEGKSLLPIGVTAVRGEFGRGALVGCVDEAGHEIARGLTNYTSGEVKRIMRHASSEIEGILGYVEAPELVHRDNLVLL
jgi:glutamate 5-kinase